MDKKKILVVSRSFFPESSPRSFRTTELVKEFARQGHQVTLLTNDRSYDYTDFIAKYPVKIESFGPLSWKSPKNSKFLGTIGRKISRLLFLLLEYPNIEIMFRLRNVLKKYQDFDLMISIAVPHPVHWGVAMARKPKHQIAKTWVADCGDPFMGNTLESIRPPAYFAILEKMFCRKADFISVPTQGSKNGYYKEFHNKIVVIPQGFDFAEFKVEKSATANKVPTFGYAGGLSSTGIRNPKPFVNYLLSTGRPFQFHVFSRNHNVLAGLQQQAPDKIVLHDNVAREVLLNKLAALDFVVNFDNGSVNQTPSKLIDYALVEKAVLNIAAEIPDEKMIDEFLNGDYSKRLEIPDLSNYDIRNVAAKFLELLK